MVEALARVATQPRDPALRRGWVRRVLRAFLVSRLVVLAIAVVTVLTRRDPGAGPWPRIPGPHLALLRVFARWDAAWYLDLAQHGYHRASVPPGGDAGYAFFPLFPWLVRACSWFTLGSPLVAALLLTTLLGVVAALLIRIVAAEVCTDEAADRAAILFCFFPASFVLSMAYTEALTIAAAAGALWALSRRRWVTAGLLGAVATMTRPTAAVLVLATTWVAYRAWRRGEGARPFVAPVLAAAGTVVVVGYQWALTGHPLEWLRVEHTSWQDRSGFTFDVVSRFWDFVQSGTVGVGIGELNDVVWSVGFLVAAAGVWLLIRHRFPAPLVIYGVGAVLFAASSYNVGPRPRPLLVAFPLIIAIGAWARGWRWPLVLGISVVGLVALTAVSFLTVAAVP